MFQHVEHQHVIEQPKSYKYMLRSHDTTEIDQPVDPTSWNDRTNPFNRRFNQQLDI